MRALVLTGPGEIGVQTVPDPAPQRGEVVVEVAGSGICGTDLHKLHGVDLYNAVYPLILGHEFYGRVAAIAGPTRGLSEGQWVVIDPAWRCGACPECQRGRPTICDNKGGYGIGRNGGFAEFAVVERSYVTPIPEGMAPHRAVLVEPLACVLNGVDRVGPVLGDNVLIMGSGTIGLLLGRLLREAGAGRIGIVDTNEARLEIARRFIDADVATTPGALAQERGWDVVADATGVPAAMAAGLAVLAKRGRFLMMGVTRPSDTLSIPCMQLVRAEQSIITSVSVNYTVSRALGLLALGRFDVDLLLDRPFPFERHEEAFHNLETGQGLKIVLSARPS